MESIKIKMQYGRLEVGVADSMEERRYKENSRTSQSVTTFSFLCEDEIIILFIFYSFQLHLLEFIFKVNLQFSKIL